MRNCVLCKAMASAYCESDQAFLCWDCDARVHGANFIVSRHSRSLLCHSCQSPTPWKASGSKLGHTMSLCESCVNGSMMHSGEGEEEEEEINRAEEEEEIDGAEEEDVDDVDLEDRDEDDEDGENQVVPWSAIPQPPAASSSSSEGTSSRFSGGSLSRDASKKFAMFSSKRMREELCGSSSENQDSESVAMVAESTTGNVKTCIGSASSRRPNDRRYGTNRQVHLKDMESGPTRTTTDSMNNMPFQRRGRRY